MYQEMDENGQYQLDCRLDSERNLEENVSVMIAFAHKQLEASVGNNFVKNRYEGYGLLSEQFSGLAKALKEVGGGMQMFLKIMPLGDSRAIDAVASIENSLADVTIQAVKMAAEAHRINDDLYHNAPETTPLEDYMAENDGFEDAGDSAPDADLGGLEDPESLDRTDEGLGETDVCLDGTDKGLNGTYNHLNGTVNEP